MNKHTGEIWNQQQRQGHPLHCTPYYGSFSPALAGFFIDRFTEPGQIVFDPFAGRGTVPLEASLRGRLGFWQERNPYARALLQGKETLSGSADLDGLVDRIYDTLEQIRLDGFEDCSDDILYEWDEQGLLTFFHPDVAYELEKLRHFCSYEAPAQEEALVLKMVVCSILTGHSAGYLSVRTLPPNQQISPDRQRLLNQKHGLQPENKNVYQLIWARLLRFLKTPLPETYGMQEASPNMEFGAHLILTSPPFLDVIDYSKINWIRNWWLGDPHLQLELWHEQDVKAWQLAMWGWLRQWQQRLDADGVLCIEAGKVRKGQVDLIEEVRKVAPRAGFRAHELFVQNTSHTRTARCWGVGADQGTTTQQVLVLKRA